MPMYQYACRSCDADFEKKLRMSQASEIQSCPVCGSEDTRKRIGNIAINAGTRTTAPVTRPVSSPFT